MEKVYHKPTNSIVDLTIELKKEIKQKGSINEYAKILAYPEMFTPKHLQDIVAGRLKEGKCLIECEKKPDGWLSTAGKNGISTKEDIKYSSFIKLNPHITIYSVEEKMYTREEVAKLLGKFCIDGEISKTPFSDIWINKWFEQNVK